ncbi:MAG: DUF190 domain-containing protein [Acidihalobacter sp.]|jgi:uncharacterized protein|uniref:DUF190 domain-containing protein n=1 Tax=Acidihalobacter sp. TaxID=1872108 RepID=UPI00307E83E9
MSSTVKIVRLYFKEGDKTQDHHNLMKELFHLLHDEHKVRGASVFRGVAGFGAHGVVQADDLLRLNVHLPLVLEVFDEPEVIQRIMPRLRELVPAKHIISWEAELAEE